jgi:uncharacterized protein (DUF1501 family)
VEQLFSLLDQRCRLCDGLSRREAMRIGALSAMGLSLPTLQSCVASADESARHKATAKSVILFWLTGGPPQHETWDPKPHASDDIRGEFGAIATRTPGLHVGELMPQTALLTDKIAVLRAVVSGDNAHSSSGYQMLTGVPHQPRNQENATARKPNLHPSLGAMVRRFLPEQHGLPSAMTIPHHIANVGEILWPGQDAGFLGRRFDPWLVRCDPSATDFRPPTLSLIEGMSLERLAARRHLLGQLNGALPQYQTVDRDLLNDQAFDLLSHKQGTAFRIDEESDKTRERYGMTKFGQSVLLARRLVEHGVRLVQVNWQRIEGKPNYGSWDTHEKHSFSLKDHLMPLMDQSFSALIDDLDQRGMLDETLVAWVGEFGHTPKFNNKAGRDHWGNVFSVALAGGGVRGGTVHGKSDVNAASPVEGRVEPKDISATILHCLGIKPSSLVQDEEGRPIPLSQGHVIDAIL